ncbi:putative nucleotide-binding protein containing TIR-like domain protein [compost metagenome]|uniref:TIR domain-containing protein n=1 Tax=Pseudomonas putida TaxID=303 RepID=UPI0009814A65|nr:nucleotide-binding protein [Pseudomonas putida]OMQ32882.1 hypothetical protein BKX96_22410 [Pseudomonas putida]
MSLEYLKTRFDKVGYLQTLLIARATGNGGDSYEYEQLRHELLNDAEVSEQLPVWLKMHRDLDSFWSFIKHKYPSYAERRTYLSQQFTPLLDTLEFGSSVPAPNSSVASTAVSPMSPWLPTAPRNDPVVARNKRNVFIVHGRDNEAKQEVSRFIESIGLKAIILHEQASGGRTIIEKIEHYSGDADFALVLYTPCDRGRGAHERTIPARNRARQNVVFEHGYLMAKLGRENVCALSKGEIETPNDISGVVYVDFDTSGAWKREVVKELRECGYVVNW